MNQDSTVNTANAWIKTAWMTGWITGITWTLFSSLLVLINTSVLYYTNIVDPILASRALIYMITECLRYNLPLSGEMYGWSIEDFAGGYVDVIEYVPWAILNVLVVAGLTYGIIKKNRACAVILLLHPILHIVLSLVIRGVSSYYGDIQLIFLIIFSVFSLLLLVGVWGTFSYRRVINTEESQ